MRKKHKKSVMRMVNDTSSALSTKDYDYLTMAVINGWEGTDTEKMVGILKKMIMDCSPATRKEATTLINDIEKISDRLS